MWVEEKYRCQIIKQPYVILRHVSVVLKQHGPLKGIKEVNNNIYQFKKTQQAERKNQRDKIKDRVIKSQMRNNGCLKVDYGSKAKDEGTYW